MIPWAFVVSFLAGLFWLFCKLTLFITSFGFCCLNSGRVEATPKIHRKIWCQPQRRAYVKFCFQKHFFCLYFCKHICSCWTVVYPDSSSWDQHLTIWFSLWKVPWRHTTFHSLLVLSKKKTVVSHKKSVTYFFKCVTISLNYIPGYNLSGVYNCHYFMSLNFLQFHFPFKHAF